MQHHEVRYLILELSAERREHQRQTLKSLAPGLMDRVGWLETFPETFAGVVVANELLDAMPVQLFEWQANAEAELQEMGVTWVDGQFAWAPRPADAVLTETVTALRNRLGPEGAQWHSPYRSEICPAQQAWMRTLADCMTAGVVMLLDYGFATPECQKAGSCRAAMRGATANSMNSANNMPRLAQAIRDRSGRGGRCGVACGPAAGRRTSSSKAAQATPSQPWAMKMCVAAAPARRASGRIWNISGAATRPMPAPLPHHRAAANRARRWRKRAEGMAAAAAIRYRPR